MNHLFTSLLGWIHERHVDTRGYRGMGGVRGLQDTIVVPQGVRDVAVDVDGQQHPACPCNQRVITIERA